nr:MAG TPA: hypothetical protein [Caudoviricetes sp.]
MLSLHVFDIAFYERGWLLFILFLFYINYYESI